MNITPLRMQNNLKLDFKAKQKEQKKPEAIKKEYNVSSLEPLASYNKALIEELPELKPEDLEYSPLSLEEDIAQYENGSINLSAIKDYAGGELAYHLRQVLKNSEIKDNIPEYVKKYRKAIAENKGRIPYDKIDENLSDKEDQMLKKLAIASYEIRKTGRKTQAHTLYRMVGTDYRATNPREYIDSLKQLKPGDETMLSICPLYTSPNAKMLADTYPSEVLLQIEMPEGSYYTETEFAQGFTESFVEPCAKFEVIGKKEYKGITLIKLKYILPD